MSDNKKSEKAWKENTMRKPLSVQNQTKGNACLKKFFDLSPSTILIIELWSYLTIITSVLKPKNDQQPAEEHYPITHLIKYSVIEESKKLEQTLPMNWSNQKR